MSRWLERGGWLRAWLLLALAFTCTGSGWAQEVMPPKPAAYFNDYAKVVDPAVVRSLDAKLRQFERETSNQIVVAVFPKLQTQSSVADYTQRIASSWKVGQKDKDNGAILFVFVEARKVFIQVGYGLEGSLPDAICKRIIAEEIAPRFKTGDYSGGLDIGVESMLKATRGEYKGSGRTAGDKMKDGASHPLVGILVIVILFWFARWISRRGVVYSGKGRSRDGGFPWIIPSGGGGGWGGSSGGGSSDGGGFFGGGGDFGGGGAGGDW